jgi:opacity protein-like surface antigen
LTNDVKKAGIDFGFGLGYDVSDKIHLQARYAFEVSNRVKDSETDVTARFNWLHIGVGYSF